MAIFSRIQMLLAMEFLVAPGTKSYQILSIVMAEAAPRLNLMDLKIFRSSTKLAMPTVSLQDFPAELAIGLRFELQAWPFGSNSSQGAT